MCIINISIIYSWLKITHYFAADWRHHCTTYSSFYFLFLLIVCLNCIWALYVKIIILGCSPISRLAIAITWLLRRWQWCLQKCSRPYFWRLFLLNIFLLLRTILFLKLERIFPVCLLLEITKICVRKINFWSNKCPWWAVARFLLAMHGLDWSKLIFLIEIICNIWWYLDLYLPSICRFGTFNIL